MQTCFNFFIFKKIVGGSPQTKASNVVFVHKAYLYSNNKKTIKKRIIIIKIKIKRNNNKKKL